MLHVEKSPIARGDVIFIASGMRNLAKDDSGWEFLFFKKKPQKYCFLLKNESTKSRNIKSGRAIKCKVEQRIPSSDFLMSKPYLKLPYINLTIPRDEQEHITNEDVTFQ